MSERPEERFQPADDGELLSAYLDGELDPRQEAELEERLASDPALAERLERTRDVLEALAGLRATPPAGFHERLRQRLEVERTAGDPAGDAGASDAGDAGARHTTGRPLGGWRPGHGRRSRSRPGGARPAGTRPEGVRSAAAGPATRRARRWQPLGAVAAAALALAVLGGLVTSLGGRQQADEVTMAGEAGAPADGGDDAAFEFQAEGETDSGVEESLDDEAAGDAAEEGEGQDAPTSAARSALPPQPAVARTGAELPDRESAREYFSALDEPVAFLGLPVEEAEEVASAFVVALRRAEPYASGVAPDRCLDVVTAGDGPLVPVRVDEVVHEEAPALAYVIVRATSGAGALDRVEGWVVEADRCHVLLVFDDLAASG